MENSLEKLVVTHWIFQWQWFQFYDESKCSFEIIFYFLKILNFVYVFKMKIYYQKYTYTVIPCETVRGW